MVEMIEANWLLLVIALVIGLLVAWWVFVSSRRTKVQVEAKDEAAAGPAKRNQALIDAPPAVAGSTTVAPKTSAPAEPVVPPPTPMGLAGAGEAVQAVALPEADPDVAPDGVADSDADPAPPASFPEPADQGDHEPPPPPESGDDLTQIKGLGPKLHAQLNELGITTFAEIAGWGEADIDRVDAQLGRFQGRIRRDDWPAQARLLAAGDTAGYQERFGKL